MFQVVAHRRLWYTCSGILVAASVIAAGIWGLNLGIDFTGGSLVELSFAQERPAARAITERVESVGATRVLVQLAGEHNAIIRTAFMTPDVRAAITKAFASDATEARFESIGPTIGRELARKTVIGVTLALILIVAYVGWMFRRAGREVSSLAYGMVTLVSMAHTVLIPIGVFAVLGAFVGVEIDAQFIAALLTILGYSINDTIIILDRIRENVTGSRYTGAFADVVEQSVRQSFTRSLNTGLATLAALLAIVLFGGASVRFFALAIMIGIAIGTYSSIFIAAPLLVTWYERKHRTA
ncbi:MAG: protein translocase subunit SecF [bacterium]|nr:protein translocase subunit SecF [bacterium]